MKATVYQYECPLPKRMRSRKMKIVTIHIMKAEIDIHYTLEDSRTLSIVRQYLFVKLQLSSFRRSSCTLHDKKNHCWYNIHPIFSEERSIVSLLTLRPFRSLALHLLYKCQRIRGRPLGKKE